MIEELSRIDKRLERIEGKLDTHMERSARQEAEIHSIRGTIKLILTVIGAAASAALTYLLGVIR